MHSLQLHTFCHSLYEMPCSVQSLISIFQKDTQLSDQLLGVEIWEIQTQHIVVAHGQVSMVKSKQAQLLTDHGLNSVT